MKYISETQVRETLTVRDCIEVLRDAFARDFINIPRYRLKSENSLLHVMSASIPSLEIMGLKSYSTSRTCNEFAVLLWNEKTGALLAVIAADALGQIRTGAASGLATDLLANADAAIGAVIGTGYQAETQLLAIDSVRNFSEIRIYSRSLEKRRKFVNTMQGTVRARLVETDSAENCVRGADVVCTITTARDPVVTGEWLKGGCHINAAGSNWRTKAEIDATAVQRADVITVDHLEQSKIEAGDLIRAFGDNDALWESVCELADVVRGKVKRTSPDQITLFKTNGMAMEDVAAANFVLSRVGAGL
jgi:alanine dehydrogenase